MNTTKRAIFGAICGVLLFAVYAWAGDGIGGFFGDLIGGVATGGIGGILGGITGLFGNWMNNRAKSQEREANHAHEESMARIDQEGMKLQADLDIKKEQIIADGVVDKLVADSRKAAIQASSVGSEVVQLVDRMLDGGIWLSFFGSCASLALVMVYILVKAIRPGIFIYFVYLFHTVLVSLLKETGALGELSKGELLKYAVFQISYFVSMAGSFYFCERNRHAQPSFSSVGAGGSAPTPPPPGAGDIESLNLNAKPEKLDESP